MRDITGWDAIADGRDYTDGPSARKALARAGFRNMLELCEARFVEVHISQAMRGDLVFPDGDLTPLSSPFVLGGAMAFSKNMTGPIIINRADCVRAFSY